MKSICRAVIFDLLIRTTKHGITLNDLRTRKVNIQLPWTQRYIYFYLSAIMRKINGLSVIIAEIKSYIESDDCRRQN